MFVSRKRNYWSSCEEVQREKTKWEGISLISKLTGLLEMNAAFLWRVMVLVCNMVPQHRAYITEHNAYLSSSKASRHCGDGSVALFVCQQQKAKGIRLLRPLVSHSVTALCWNLIATCYCKNVNQSTMARLLDEEEGVLNF
jgi:hypothetical protein